MRWGYRHLIRPFLFTQDAETIHEFTLEQLHRVSRSPYLREVVASFLAAPTLPVDAWGLRFPNPVGLAAGMDKNARAVAAWEALGFGFSELGGVTWHAQPGNPKPRVFRAIPAEAIVNRMGFNNEGAMALAATLRAARARGDWPMHPVGINLGKSKITPLASAPEDYANSFRLLRDLADFFVVNVSSPNTPNLRQLQDQAALDEILLALEEVQRAAGGSRKPVLVKVAPDLTFEALDDILALVTRRGLAGIVATNTTITRPEAPDPRSQRAFGEPGGLSGPPLRQRSTEVIRHLFRQSRGRIPIIGVGGIASAEDAWGKITAGATLIQVYTGLVFAGPTLARSIVMGLRQRLAESGCRRLTDAVGSAA
jgi:dihydroorotate dehydrogenase